MSNEWTAYDQPFLDWVRREGGPPKPGRAEAAHDTHDAHDGRAAHDTHDAHDGRWGYLRGYEDGFGAGFHAGRASVLPHPNAAPPPPAPPPAGLLAEEEAIRVLEYVSVPYDGARTLALLRGRGVALVRLPPEGEGR